MRQIRGKYHHFLPYLHQHIAYFFNELYGIAFKKNEEFMLAVLNCRKITRIWRRPNSGHCYAPPDMVIQLARRGFEQSMRIVLTWKTLAMDKDNGGYSACYNIPYAKDLANPVYRTLLRDSNYDSIRTQMIYYMNMEKKVSNSVQQMCMNPARYTSALHWRIARFWTSVVPSWIQKHRNAVKAFNGSLREIPHISTIIEKCHLIREPGKLMNRVLASQENQEWLWANIRMFTPSQAWFHKHVDSALPSIKRWFVTLVDSAARSSYAVRALHKMIHATRSSSIHALPWLQFTIGILSRTSNKNVHKLYAIQLEQLYKFAARGLTIAATPSINDTLPFSIVHKLVKLKMTYEKCNYTQILQQPGVQKYMYSQKLTTFIISRMNHLDIAHCKQPFLAQLSKSPEFRIDYLRLHVYYIVKLRNFIRSIPKPEVGECFVCMDENARLYALHGDKRHSVCRDCRAQILEKNPICPMCRTSLRTYSHMHHSSQMFRDSYHTHDYDEYDNYPSDSEDDYRYEY